MQKAVHKNRLRSDSGKDWEKAAPTQEAVTGTWCTDEPDSWMKGEGKTCDSWTWGIKQCNKCIQSTWAEPKYCQYSCYMAGCGYGDDCHGPRPTPPPSTYVSAVTQKKMPNASKAQPATARSACPEDAPGILHDYYVPAESSGNGYVPSGLAVVRQSFSFPNLHLVIPADATLVLADGVDVKLAEIVVLGKLLVGSATCPAETGVTITLAGEPGDFEKPVHHHGQKGIVVPDGGTLEMFGRRPYPTWTRLAQTAYRGDAAISIEDPVDWRVGEWVVVVTTVWMDDPAVGKHQNEKRQIKSVEGHTITLSAPLDHTHYGGPEYSAEVALLNRTITIQGDEGSVNSQYGGHTMCMEGSTCKWNGVLAYRMGQLNVMGHYPFHFHVAREASDRLFFRDCAVVESYFRAFTVHGTNNTMVERNVAFDVWGSAYYLEDGIEEYNKFHFNLAAHVHVIKPLPSYDPKPDDNCMGDPSVERSSCMGSASQSGFRDIATEPLRIVASDVSAVGFYCTNMNNEWVGNTASGGFSGFMFPALPRVLGISYTKFNAGDHSPLERPLGLFDSNTAHSSGRLWNSHGANLYVGGMLWNEPLGSSHYVYSYGRIVGGSAYFRHVQERMGGVKFSPTRPDYTFTNTKLAVSTLGGAFWHSNEKVLRGYECHDVFKAGQLMGGTTIIGGVFTGHTYNDDIGEWGDHKLASESNLFEQYDLDMHTEILDAHFRGLYRPGDVAVKDVTRSAVITSTWTMKGITFDPSVLPQQMFRHVKTPACEMRELAGSTCSDRADQKYGTGWSCTKCPGTSYSSQITALELVDGLFGTGISVEGGALLGGDDGEHETAGITNDWWRLDENCVSHFDNSQSGGFWVCPTYGTRKIVRFAVLNGHPAEKVDARVVLGSPEVAKPDAIDGTIYHFGRKDRRLQLGFGGIPVVATACCDVGLYVSFAAGSVEKFSVFPFLLVPTGGLVLATSYPVGSTLVVQACHRMWRNGKLILRECKDVFTASSLSGLRAHEGSAFFLEPGSKTDRLYFKVQNPEQDVAHIAGLDIMVEDRGSMWFEVTSSKWGPVDLDLPAVL